MLIYHLLAHKSFPLIPLKIQLLRRLKTSPQNNDHLAKGLKNPGILSLSVQQCQGIKWKRWLYSVLGSSAVSPRLLPGQGVAVSGTMCPCPTSARRGGSHGPFPAPDWDRLSLSLRTDRGAPKRVEDFPVTSAGFGFGLFYKTLLRNSSSTGGDLQVFRWELPTQYFRICFCLSCSFDSQ